MLIKLWKSGGQGSVGTNSLFQQGHMKDRVDFGLWRELEAIRHCTNVFSDAKRAIEAWGELVRRTLDEGLLEVRVELKINPVTLSKSTLCAVLV